LVALVIPVVAAAAEIQEIMEAMLQEPAIALVAAAVPVVAAAAE
jgi:hypothetical protein